MIFKETHIKGAFIIELDKITDERGFFARAWCRNEFEAHNLNTNLVQVNIAFNKKKGTMRGMHYQISPYEETKLVRCTKGAIYDVIVDIREGSPTYMQWIGVALSEDNHRMLYVPGGFAHGYQTLEDNTEVTYQVTQYYVPKAEQGICWNDPAFNISWPDTEVRIVSEKDQKWADFKGRKPV